MAQTSKKYGLTTVLGGPHLTIMPRESLEPQHSYVDYVFKGEAEHTFLELVNTIEAGRPVFRVAPRCRRPATALTTDVPLLTCYPGIDPGEFTRLVEGCRGIVVEVFGDLNVPRQLWGPIHEAWNAGVLVVLASRPFTATTGNEGLSLLGAVGAGGLTAQKARLATMAVLGTFAARDDAIEFLHRCALTYDPLDRSTR